MTYDIKITGGEIIDGTGKRRYQGDIGIKDDRIVAVGNAPDDAAQTIDAAGRIVAPGFIDVHTHYDAQVIWDRMLTPSHWHGVTSVVTGNCGFGMAPTRTEHRDLIIRTLERVEGMSVEALEEGLGNEWPFVSFPDYLNMVEAMGTAINVGVLMGHTPVRLYVMGRDAVERAATEDEIAEMRALVREGIEAGAIGFSTSFQPLHNGFDGKPVPSRLADFEEFAALAGELGAAGKGLIHLAMSDDPPFEQMAALSERTGRNVCWNSILTRPAAPGRALELLDRANALIAEGYRVYPQVSCRPLTIELRLKAPFSLERFEFFRKVARADFDGKKKFYADPAFRKELRDQFDLKGDEAEPMKTTRVGWLNGTITHCPADPALEERSIAEVARERGMHIMDLALDLSLADNLETRFRLPVVNTDEGEVAQLLRDPNPVLGLSDAGAHLSQLCDACFATYLLGHWVRDKQAISLEQGVRMLTGKPADVYGIAGRGELAEGYYADVVVFDPQTVGASKLSRVYDQPAGADRLIATASGIDKVIVNGTLLRDGDTDLADAEGELPGRLLRSGGAA